MEQKLAILSSVAAFLVAWLSGLAAGVPTDVILMRSVLGAVVFYALSISLCRVFAAVLDLPCEVPERPVSGPNTEVNGPEIKSKD